MKGMQKISRGSSFSGVMAYAFEGDLDNPRDLEGEVIGGNMIARDPRGLAAEFNDSKAIRPDVQKPVWHNSLRLPEGEKLDNDKWAEIGDAYMKKMGFSENHQRVYVLHDDPQGQHIHIVASRIGLDGQLFLGKNENLISTKKIAELERDFNLTITKGANYDSTGKVVMPDVSRPRRGEVGLFERTGEAPKRFALTEIIDKALADKPTAKVFAERLSLAGIEVRANFSKDKLNGFSFAIDGVGFKGSQLGKQYTGKALFERGLTYEQDRDYAYLREISAAAKGAADNRRSADVDKQPGAERDRVRDGAGARDSSDLRRADRSTDRASDRATPAVDPTSSRLSERPERLITESEHGAERAVDSDRDSKGAGTDPAKAGAERPDVPGASVAPAREHGHQPGDVGHGIATGVEVSDAGFISTGDKAIDELLKASHKGRISAEREALARQKKQHAEDMQASKKRQADMDKPNTSRLNSLADRALDDAWRTLEIQRFAQSLGAGKFQVVCTPANAKAEPIKHVLTAADLQNPKVIKSIAHLAARNHQVTIQPHESAGVLLLKGLDADGIKKLEAAGLQPAAVVTFAGKHQAWIATGATMSADERKALTQRIESLVGLQKSSGVSGRLVGFAGAGLVACSGRVAPGAAELLGEIKSQIFEAKAARRLEQAIEKTVVVKAHDFDDVGGIKNLRRGWFNDSCHAAEAEATFFGGKYAADQVERGVLEAMARQGVKPGQAYQVVYEESRVEHRNEQHAAHAVAQAYTRVALQKEGRELTGIDLKVESAKRYPDLFKRAESRVDAESEAFRAKVRQDGIEEQRRLDQEAEQRRVAKALELAEKVAREREQALTRG